MHNSLHLYDNVFNWTWSYRSDSTIPNGYHGTLRWIPLNSSTVLSTEKFDSFMKKWIEKKTGLVSWIVSNCRTFSQRESYVAEMEKIFPISIYGMCNRHPIQASEADSIKGK